MSLVALRQQQEHPVRCMQQCASRNMLPYFFIIDHLSQPYSAVCTSNGHILRFVYFSDSDLELLVQSSPWKIFSQESNRPFVNTDFSDFDRIRQISPRRTQTLRRGVDHLGVLVGNEQQNEADNEEENMFQPSLADIFRDWMISTNVPFSTVNRLLVSLQHKLPELPQDARTLMRTPRSCPTREVPPEEDIHLGIANGLRRVVPMYLPPQPYIIHLHMNVNVMKLHNNGTTVIWPILARIVRPFTSPVFLVGLYGGVRKPEDVCTYLNDVVQELEELLRLGVVVNDLHHQVVLDAIICDKPARSFVTRVRGYNSYYGCDYMHAVCLGVVRRLVSIFVNVDRPVRIGPAGLNMIA
ncbi:hypothetical protein T265_02672 [Opisthorchis viverrini]|uniref:Uncharacterized protein n=1 Tax=Opisthorchis viverrini TaxID=6198 RepID=A0A075A5T7_OPIVI|nr:hypothetical protein T265_02672 [Opisthorchis viverrini]KER30995.1 hypothetical protein T265_02672 [Opisthorchis viverrini]